MRFVRDSSESSDLVFGKFGFFGFGFSEKFGFFGFVFLGFTFFGKFGFLGLFGKTLLNQINKVGDKSGQKNTKPHVTSEKMKKDILSASYPRENDRLMTTFLDQIAHFSHFFQNSVFFESFLPSGNAVPKILC